MKDQPWDLNQTWYVVRKWCRFINAPQNFWVGALSQKIWKQKYHFRPLLATSALCCISPERNVASTNQNTSVNLQYVPYELTYFMWPRNGWDLLAHWDPPMKIQHFSNFCRNKSATKFLCVKTYSGRVIATSFPYLTVHGWIAGDVPIYLKFVIKVARLMKIQLFSSLPGFPHKGQ